MPYTQVGKAWVASARVIPWSWQNMVMIMSRWQQGGYVSWYGHHDSWHDNGMTTMFLMIHTSIILWSLFFLFFFRKKIRFLVNIFSHSCWHIPLTHLTGIRRCYLCTLLSQRKWTKITPERLRVFFCDNQRAFLFNNSFNIKYKLQLVFNCGKFEFMGNEIHFPF